MTTQTLERDESPDATGPSVITDIDPDQRTNKSDGTPEPPG